MLKSIWLVAALLVTVSLGLVTSIRSGQGTELVKLEDHFLLEEELRCPTWLTNVIGQEWALRIVGTRVIGASGLLQSKKELSPRAWPAALFGYSTRLTSKVDEMIMAELGEHRSLKRLDFTIFALQSTRGVYPSITNPGETQIADESLRHLIGLPLDKLVLSGSTITDAGCDSIATLVSLKELHLTTTRVTDAGLRKLESLNDLEFLDVTNTKCTLDGVARFRGVLPDCEVLYWYRGTK